MSDSITQDAQARPEKRKHVRSHLAMRATLRGGELEGKTCQISNFSSGGLFISLLNKADIEQVLANEDSLLNNNFSIEFQIKHKNIGEKTYSTSIKVVRVFKTGIGVSFVDSEQIVLKILAQVCKLTEKKLAQGAATEKLSSTQSSQDMSSTLLKATDFDLNQKLSSLLNSYLSEFENKLLQVMKVTPEEKQKERDEYFNVYEIINKDKTKVIDEILLAVNNQLNGKPALLWEESDKDEDDSRSLSLVDETEFESYLVITGIISDAEAEHHELLFKVFKKISTLFKTEFEQSKNPIGFSRLLRTISCYFHEQQFGFQALELSYHLMKDILEPGLVSLYEELTLGFEANYESKKQNPSAPREKVSSRQQEVMMDPPNSNSSMVSNQLQNQTNILNNQPKGHGGVSQEPLISNYENGNNDSFPSLQVDQPSAAIEPSTVENLTQTLSALQKNISTPGILQNILEGTVHQGQFISKDKVENNYQATQQGQLFSGQQQVEMLEFINQIQQENQKKWQNGETIGIVANRLPQLLQGNQTNIGAEVEVALSRIANVLEHLESDQYLSNPTRINIKRIETVLYKQAVMGNSTFINRQNPLRNMINLLEELDLKGGSRDAQSEKALDSLIGQVLSLDNFDTTNLEQISSNIKHLIDQQDKLNEKRISELVAQADIEYSTMSNLKKDGDSEVLNKSAQMALTNSEYKVWHDRVSSMQRGDSIVVDIANGEKSYQTLAWVSPDLNRFIFVDSEGIKVADMTHQELTVRLLKGTADITDVNQKPLFDRALTSSLFSEYSEVQGQIILDPETGFMSNQKFLLELDLICKDALRNHVEHALYYLSFTGNDQQKMIDCMKPVLAYAQDLFGKRCFVGRLEEDVVVITAEYINQEDAFTSAEKLLTLLEDKLNQSRLSLSIGIAMISDRIKDKENLVDNAAAANDQAQYLSDQKIFLYTDDSDLTERQIEDDTFDWGVWLQMYTSSESTIPVFGQPIQFKGAKKTKPILHVFAAHEDYQISNRTPEHFINSLSDSDLISLFEKKYIQSVLDWMSENKKFVAQYSRCLINLSATTICQKNILEFVIEKLTESSVPPGKICFGVPGNIEKGERTNLVRFMRTLKEYGCHFSLQQLGSDGADQEMLKLPISYVCIDETLTNSMVENPQSFALIKSLNDISHMLEKHTVVPHSIDQDAVELLDEMKVDFISDKELKVNQLNKETIVESDG